MAMRLADYLRPRESAEEGRLPERPNTGPSRPVEQAGEGKWGFWKSKSSSASIPQRLVDEQRVNVREKEEKNGRGDVGKVILDVKAAEVVFRFENDFGIFEMESGWGVMLKLRVELGR